MSIQVESFRGLTLLLRGVVVAFAALAWSPLSHAAAADVLKAISIFGSLASYGHGYVLADHLSCKESFRAGLHVLKDQELTATSFSMGLRDCDAALQAMDMQGLRFRLSPTVMLSGWQADGSAAEQGTSELTLTPKVFYVWPAYGQQLDIGFGIGVSYLMDTSVGNRVKSTNFQFSDEFSLGISDASDTYRIAYQYRHISNLDIKTPNNAVDFNGITLTIRMR